MVEIAAFSRLSDTSVLQIEGSEATRFAQAQFMNDLDTLEVGSWQWNGWLNAKGRLIALFLLARPGPDRLWLVLPDMAAGELLPRLQRMVFRSKVALSLPALVACAAPGASPPAARALVQDEDRWRLSPDGHRVLALIPETSLPANQDATAAWRDADLAAGIPRLDTAQAERWTPHMLSLQSLPAFSVRKGCYPGQEIVARTHFLGQSRRSLWRIEGEALAPGELMDADGQSVGDVFAVDSRRRLGLAVAAGPPGVWTCGGLAVEVKPPHGA